MTATTPVEQKAGTLVIDMWDAKTMKIVWRGTMTSTIPANPQKSHKKLDKGIEKMVEKWRKMYAKDHAEGQ
jgi:ribosome recycling factor